MDSESEQACPATANSKVQLFAAGLNAHGQISAAWRGHDIPSLLALTAPADASSVQLLHASWSATTLRVASQVIELGRSDAGPRTLASEAGEPFDTFGHHDGMLGFLDAEGRLWLSVAGRLECQADPDGSPLVGHIAHASNGKVAITFKQAPNRRLCHILCFDDLGQLLAWYKNPAEVSYDAEKQHFMMQGQPRQLLAGTGTFLLRMESGEVYSWGDPRYSSLGRSIDEFAAERPGPVEALGGLKIAKIACGGWLNAALSEDGACYVWGAQTPGTEEKMQLLTDLQKGGVALVELPAGEGGEPPDILDVAVGDNHVVLLADGSRCFAAGGNSNGQLCLQHFEPFVPKFTRVPIEGYVVRSIYCGPKSTYAFASPVDKPPTSA